MEYLSFWVTRDVLKPVNKKIEAITNMKPPTYEKKGTKFYRCSKLLPKYVAKEVTYVSSFN